jgi:DNA polymerase-3 subunit epsilon
MQLYEAPLAIVDVETTGTQPARDRITEIAVLEVDRWQVSCEWSTLVNPGESIPAEIQALTGISNRMVQDAPQFPDLARELHERLAGRVFVAHNVRFDYGFLRREFDRAGIKFLAKTLCTVKLARRLYPEEESHTLDSIIDRHGITCYARHRAHGDADALWRFLRLAAEEHGEEIVGVAARQVAKQPTLPPQVDRAMIDTIPEAPGVYIFYGEGALPLYVGKSLAMRSRVLAHFGDDVRSARAMQLAREVRRIDWQRTAGELGALLREAELVKELAPAYNRQLRKANSLCGFVFDGKRLRLADEAEIDAETLPFVYGVFRSRRAALAALHDLADAHGLCLQALGYDVPRHGACFRHQIGRCAGVCAGKESIHRHHARLATELARLKAKPWRHRGVLGIVEHDENRDATEVHIVDRWCYLGTARSEDEVAELLEERRRAAFDYDQYRILARHLDKPGVRLVELAN